MYKLPNSIHKLYKVPIWKERNAINFGHQASFYYWFRRLPFDKWQPEVKCNGEITRSKFCSLRIALDIRPWWMGNVKVLTGCAHHGCRWPLFIHAPWATSEWWVGSFLERKTDNVVTLLLGFLGLIFTQFDFNGKLWIYERLCWIFISKTCSGKVST